jgi:uncharacterized protein (DUF849 family)
MILKCCLNGPRLPAEHPALPVTPAQLAEAAAAAVAAGAQAIHFHPKDGAGRDTLDSGAVAQALDAIRSAVPGVPVGTTTGAWAAPDPADRVRLVESWTTRPDFASVNWHEPGAEDVAAALLSAGVGVEAGLWTMAAIALWLASPNRDACLRVLIELPDGLDEIPTLALADRLVNAVTAEAFGSAPLLLHGEGSSCWPALRHAVRLGLQRRIGLEDVLTMPDGAPALDNAALVQAARAFEPGEE